MRLTATTRFVVVDDPQPTQLIPNGNGYRFVAGRLVQPVFGRCEVVGIDTDRDGRLDLRSTLAVKLHDANNNGIADPGETIDVAHKVSESLHDQACPFLPPDLFRRAVQRIADRINGLFLRGTTK